MDVLLALVVADRFRELRTLAGNSAYVLPGHSCSRAARYGCDNHLNKDTLRESIDRWLRTATLAVRRFTRTTCAAPWNRSCARWACRATSRVCA
ncbi:MAG: hypothetical protein IV093_01835 [Rubrivivax sp.]|nr:hypothetical protein [Rubrivivax sp.]